MIAGEIALIAAIVVGLGVSVPLTLLAVVIAIQILANPLVSRRVNADATNADHWVGALFLLDALAMTLILGLTGGPANPFSLLYLVQITFSAVILNRAWTWALGALSMLSFGLLFWVSREVPAFQAHLISGRLSLHLAGMWVAFATGAVMITFFIGQVSEEARRKEREILLMQQRLARNERLASLVTLAAGAAHEMATPLATIAITAKEIERAAQLGTSDPVVQDDAKLIRSEVDRCRLILERMGAQGADPLGEAPRTVPFRDLFAGVRERFPNDGHRIEIEVNGGGPETCVIPPRAAIEALSALVKNALDASPDGQPVTLAARSESDRFRLEVRDHGVGMTTEVIERIVEPFFTTKAPGQGMGLGAFLAHLFAQSLGGQLSFDSQPGRGCVAAMEFRVSQSASAHG
jgi:two-component system sensor histidine kinase RegB